MNVSPDVAWLERGPGGLRHGPGWSDDHGWQTDDGIIAQGGHDFQGHGAGPLNGRFVVLFEQDRADEAEDGFLVEEDRDDLDVFGRKTHAGETVVFGLVP